MKPELKNILELLEKISFFEVFTKEEKITIAGCKNHLVKYDEGEYIIRQDEVEVSIYVLIVGKAVVTRKEAPNTSIAKLKLGDIFGEIAYLTQNPRSTNIIADDQCMTLKMDSQFFEETGEIIHRKIEQQFVNLLIQKIETNNAAIVDLKTELTAIRHSGIRMVADLDKMIESGRTVKEGLKTLDDTLSTIIR